VHQWPQLRRQHADHRGESDQRIRWYVFNLDLGPTWHNFHTHAQRWRWADQNVDTRSLGPAESFVANTVVPHVVLSQRQIREKEDEKKHKKEEREKKKVEVCGDFPFHCHVEMHMMGGMVGLVRAKQFVFIDEPLGKEYPFTLRSDCSSNDCPEVDPMRCRQAGVGRWDSLPDLPIFVVHAAVSHTGKVLLYSGTAEVGYPDESRVWDPVANTLTSQTYDEDLFCSGHTFLADGKLLVAGGAPRGSLRSTHIFDPVGESWTHLTGVDMSVARWYPTLVPLPDGRVLAATGTSGSAVMEIFDPTVPAGRP
jgi:hypothetical protein